MFFELPLLLMTFCLSKFGLIMVLGAMGGQRETPLKSREGPLDEPVVFMLPLIELLNFCGPLLFSLVRSAETPELTSLDSWLG